MESADVFNPANLHALKTARVNLVPYFIDALQKQVADAWKILESAPDRSVLLPNLLSENEQEIVIELAQLERISAENGSSTLLALEALQLGILGVAAASGADAGITAPLLGTNASTSSNSIQRNGAVVNESSTSSASSSSRRKRKGDHTSDEAIGGTDTLLSTKTQRTNSDFLLESTCYLAISMLRNLERRASNGAADGVNDLSSAVAPGLVPAEVQRRLEQLLGCYTQLVSVLRMYLDVTWHHNGACGTGLASTRVGCIIHLTCQLVQCITVLVRKCGQINQKKAFTTFTHSGGVELTLHVINAANALMSSSASTAAVESSAEKANANAGLGAGLLLSERARRLLDIALGLNFMKDIEELASAASQATAASAATLPVSGEKTLEKINNRTVKGKNAPTQTDGIDKGAASKRDRLQPNFGASAAAYTPSFYSSFYDSVDKYAQGSMELSIRTAIRGGRDLDKDNGKLSGSSESSSSARSPSGIATLLFLYSLGSLRVALADKLGASSHGVGNQTSNVRTSLEDDFVEANTGISIGRSASGKHDKDDAERVRLKALFSAGDAGALLAYVGTSVVSRRHIARVLRVSHAMIMRCSPAIHRARATENLAQGDCAEMEDQEDNDDDNDGRKELENVHQSYCRIQLVEALSSALQSSLPTHDSLEAQVNTFRQLTHDNVQLLMLYVRKSNKALRRINQNGSESSDSNRTQRYLAHAALELTCLHRLTSLDHRFLLDSSQEDTDEVTATGNRSEAEADMEAPNGAGSGNVAPDFKRQTLLHSVYESFLSTLLPHNSANDDDASALCEAQEQLLLLILRLHCDLSRLDTFVKDVCGLATGRPLLPDEISNLHRLLGSQSMQQQLLSSFAGIPAQQRQLIWETLATVCQSQANVKKDSSIGADTTQLIISRTALVDVLSLLVRPLSAAHTSSEGIRGPACFSPPEPGPLCAVLELAVSYLEQLDVRGSKHADTVAVPKSAKKVAKKSVEVAVSHSPVLIEECANAHIIVVAVLRLGAAAVALLSSHEVGAGAWDHLAALACGRLSRCSSVVAPLIGCDAVESDQITTLKSRQLSTETTPDAAGRRIGQAYQGAVAALLALTSFATVAQMRLGDAAALPEYVDLSASLGKTLVKACECFSVGNDSDIRSFKSQALLFPVTRLLLQHAPTWSFLDSQLSDHLVALSTLLLSSQLGYHDDSTSSASVEGSRDGDGEKRRLEILYSHVCESPLLRAGFRVAMSRSAKRVVQLLASGSGSGSERGRGRETGGSSWEELLKEHRNMTFCYRMLPHTVSSAAPKSSVTEKYSEATPSLHTDLVQVLCGAISAVLKLSGGAREDSRATIRLADVASAMLLRHVRNCSTLATSNVDTQSLFGPNKTATFLRFALLSGNMSADNIGGDICVGSTVTLACLLLDARIVGLLTSVPSPEPPKKEAEAELVSVFETLNADLQSALQHPEELGGSRLGARSKLWSTVSAALTAVDWSSPVASERKPIILRALDAILAPLTTPKASAKAAVGRSTRMPAVQCLAFAEALRSRDRINAQELRRGHGSHAVKSLLPFLLGGYADHTWAGSNLAEGDSCHNAMTDRNAWLYLLGTYLHTQRFLGLQLDANACEQIVRSVCVSLISVPLLPPPQQGDLTLVVSGLLLASPAALVAVASSELLMRASQSPLLTLRLSAAIVEANMLSRRHIDADTLRIAHDAFLGGACQLTLPSSAAVAVAVNIGVDAEFTARTALASDTALKFYAESVALIQRVLTVERENAVARRQNGSRAERGGQALAHSEADRADEADAFEDASGALAVAGTPTNVIRLWAPTCVGIVSQMAVHALSWAQLQQSPIVSCRLAILCFNAIETLYLGTTHEILNTGAGALTAALTSCVHVLLHMPIHVQAPYVCSAIGVASRTLSAAAQSKEAARQVPWLLSAVLDTVANSNFAIPKERLEALQPGLFSLLDRCSAARESKQVLAPLGGSSKAVYAELLEKYVREFKFKGRV